MAFISASILNSDFSRLNDEINRCKESGIEWLHLDVMDGHFVDTITFGSNVIASLRKTTDMFFDAHLMVTNPDKQIPFFIQAGCDNITIHVESDCNVRDSLFAIKESGIKCGISLKPDTPCEDIYPLLDIVDIVLVMTVEPGYGGQGFIERCADKVADIKNEIDSRKLDTLIQVDGGINSQTAKLCRKKGAEILVSGTCLFRSDDMKQAALSLLE